MALISRPAKLGGNTTYTDEYASGQIKIRADEVDADLAAIIAQVNGNIDAVNLGTNAVETAKIKDANVTAAKLATGAVTGDKIATDGPIVDWKSGLATTGLSITTVETDIVVLGALTTGAGLVVALMDIAYSLAPVASFAGYGIIRLYRGAVEAGIWRVYVEPGLAVSCEVPGPNFPLIERPGAGSHVYKVTGQTNGANLTIFTPPANAGALNVVSLR